MHYAGKAGDTEYLFSHIHSQSPVCCLTAFTPATLVVFCLFLPSSLCIRVFGAWKKGAVKK